MLCPASSDFGLGKWSMALSSLLPDGHPKGSWVSEPELVFTFQRAPSIEYVLSQDGEMQQSRKWAGWWALAPGPTVIIGIQGSFHTLMGQMLSDIHAMHASTFT